MGWGVQLRHTHPSSCRAQPGTEASPARWLQTHQGGPPPPAACPPAATFAQLCLVFSCLPSLGGGGAWGCEHCPHLGLGQRGARQAAPTPRAGAGEEGWGRVEREGLGPGPPRSQGGASSRGARRRHTPGGKAQARPWTLPGSTAHSRQAALGARPVLSRACRGVRQHPTGHGWAPPDIEAHAYVSHLCTRDTAGNQHQGPGPRTLGLVGGSRGEVQSPLRRKHCASHTDPGCRTSPGVPPASWEGPPSPLNSPRIGIRPTGNSTRQLTGQEAVSRFWTSALPCASFTNYSVMHSNTRPSARSWGPTNE